MEAAARKKSARGGSGSDGSIKWKRLQKNQLEVAAAVVAWLQH